jgi:hypothetical protein
LRPRGTVCRRCWSAVARSTGQDQGLLVAGKALMACCRSPGQACRPSQDAQDGLQVRGRGVEVGEPHLHPGHAIVAARRPAFAPGEATCGARKWPVTWSGWPDLNRRPLRPERSALPSCATPRDRSRSLVHLPVDTVTYFGLLAVRRATPRPGCCRAGRVGAGQGTVRRAVMRGAAWGHVVPGAHLADASRPGGA